MPMLGGQSKSIVRETVLGKPLELELENLLRAWLMGQCFIDAGQPVRRRDQPDAFGVGRAKQVLDLLLAV